MAIVPSTDYSGQIETGDAGYPHGKAKNVGVSGDGSGTPLERNWVNDIWGFFQSLLDRAGITPSGSPDEVGASDYIDALDDMIGFEKRLVRYDLASALRSGNDLDLAADSFSVRDISIGNHGYIFYRTTLTQAQRWICTVPYDLSTATIVGQTLTYNQGSNIES